MPMQDILKQSTNKYGWTVRAQTGNVSHVCNSNFLIATFYKLKWGLWNNFGLDINLLI